MESKHSGYQNGEECYGKEKGQKENSIEYRSYHCHTHHECQEAKCGYDQSINMSKFELVYRCISTKHQIHNHMKGKYNLRNVEREHEKRNPIGRTGRHKINEYVEKPKSTSEHSSYADCHPVHFVWG
mmetsp:Transcript_5558/g.13538  ORF Transcript_5558/g.13538 Transcript_5558/m.13538 type:complete len:127 (+) Transcript_5558:650-1030(+)